MANATKPRKAAVLGFPVGHSLSPRLHNYWLKQYDIVGGYEAIAVEPDQLAPFLRTLPAQGFAGVNLTIPHKELALGLVDEVDEIARRIGAINTVVVRNGKLLGTNTDAYGFMANLKAEMPLHLFPPPASGERLGEGKALVLGAGGASRAIGVSLVDAGWRVTLAARNLKKAQAIAENNTAITTIDWENITEAMNDATLLVNTTSLGMKGQPPLEISLDAMPRTAWVCDIVYAPQKTQATEKYSDPTITDLLARAMDRGLPIVGGLGMLLYQAQPAFEMWFGVKPAVTDALHYYMQEAL